MKRLSLILIALFAVGIARSMTFEKPYLLPRTCGVPDNIAVPGEQNAAGYFAGYLYQHTQCPGSGRGSKVQQYALCEAVKWDANGTVFEMAQVSYFEGTGGTYPHLASCHA